MSFGTIAESVGPHVHFPADCALPEITEELIVETLQEHVYTDETEGILFALAQAVEQRDRSTAKHCERLAFMSVAMGMALQLDRGSLLALYRGGYLHDIGKVGMPDSILFKPGPLTSEEWVLMRSHTVRGEDICRHLKSLGPVIPIIRHHHERWDGSGYPDGLRGPQIPLQARLLQIADIYDALTNPRPYKPAFTPREALNVIADETDRGWRDPDVVKLFFRLHDDVILQITESCQSEKDGVAAIGNTLASLSRLRRAPEDTPPEHACR